MAGKRGQKKVVKRTNAPKSYCLRKLGGAFAIKASPGPHSKNSSISISYLLRHNLGYAQTNNEVSGIMAKRIIAVNGKVITNEKYPVGIMDHFTINRDQEQYLVSLDSHGRFTLLPIKKNSPAANQRLLKVTKKYARSGNCTRVPTLSGNDAGAIVYQMHNGNNYRFCHPSIKVNDTLVFDVKKNTISEVYPFRLNQTVIAINGNNCGRVGKMINIDTTNKTVSVRDERADTFITKIDNVMVIGSPTGPIIPLHNSKGIRHTHVETRAIRLNLEEEGDMEVDA